MIKKQAITMIASTLFFASALTAHANWYDRFDVQLDKVGSKIPASSVIRSGDTFGFSRGEIKTSFIVDSSAFATARYPFQPITATTNFVAPKQNVNAMIYQTNPFIFTKIQFPKGSTYASASYIFGMYSKSEYNSSDWTPSVPAINQNYPLLSDAYIHAGKATISFTEYYFRYTTKDGKTTGTPVPVMRGSFSYQVKSQGSPLANRIVSAGTFTLGSINGDRVYGTNFKTNSPFYVRVASSNTFTSNVSGVIEKQVGHAWVTILSHPVYVNQNADVGLIPVELFSPGKYRISFYSPYAAIGSTTITVTGHPSARAAIFKNS